MGYFSDKFNHHNDDMQAHFKDLFDCHINDAVCVEDFFKITGGNTDLAYNLLTLFKQHAMSYVQDFHNAQTNDEKMHAIHALKGAARCIAAHKLSIISADIESMVRSNSDIPHRIIENFTQSAQNLLNYVSIVENRQ